LDAHLFFPGLEHVSSRKSLSWEMFSVGLTAP
jgi:hypothetical protein